MKMAHRFSGPGMPYEGLTELGPNGPRWNGVIHLVHDLLDAPTRWRKPARVFVNSMSDMFHQGVPDGFIDKVFAVMASCPQHQFLILTKRPERMYRYTRGVRVADLLGGSAMWPLPNVVLGVSCEDQKTLMDRVPWLLDSLAAKRFISYEPALGPIDLHAIIARDGDGPACDLSWIGSDAAIDLVIIGGESGSGARPFDLMWARNVIDQCRGTRANVFVKQLGKHPFSNRKNEIGLQIDDPKGGDSREWPADLAVRELLEMS